MGAQNSELVTQVKDDFVNIWGSYDHGRLEDAAKQRETIRSVHKYAVCLGLLSKAVVTRPEHKRIFLQESASDAMHLVHILMMGDARGGSFYLRSLVENFWRHQYFSDHEVEYGWLHTRNKYHATMQSLREYCGWLDKFSGKLKISLQALDTQYADLSTEVHSSSAKTLVLRESLAQIKLTKLQCSTLGARLHNVFKDVLVLTIFSSRDVFDGMHVNAQAFMLTCLDSTRKARRQADL
jgi:hypothetical protein